VGVKESKMEVSRLKIKHLAFGFFVGVITSYMFLSSSYISTESKCMIIIFNFLFISLTFPLNGTLAKKLSLLLIGNIVGLLWNYLFSMLAYTFAYYAGEFFNTLYIILNPFINLTWIVSFWSLSLTILAKSKKQRILKLDD
jgi:hypothetical protein